MSKKNYTADELGDEMLAVLIGAIDDGDELPTDFVDDLSMLQFKLTQTNPSSSALVINPNALNAFIHHDRPLKFPEISRLLTLVQRWRLS
jgi:hypothetical protein